jgi:hypothetical protein
MRLGLRTLPLLALIPFGACDFGDTPQLQGSGTAAEVERQISGVQAVEMRVPGELRITQGGAESLRIEADDNFLERIETSVEGGVLRISSPGVQLRPSAPLRLHLGVVEVQRVSGSGAASLFLHELQGESLEISLSGAGRVRGEGLELGRLALSLSGAADAALEGSARELSLELTGAGEVDAAELQVARARVQLTGATGARVAATEQLSGTVSGASSLTYSGDPAVEVSTSGASRLRRAAP